jgi:hypothetical protein
MKRARNSDDIDSDEYEYEESEEIVSNCVEPDQRQERENQNQEREVNDMNTAQNSRGQGRPVAKSHRISNDEDIPVVALRDLGERGPGSRSQEKSALNHLNAFLSTENLPSTSDPRFLETISKQVVGKFAHYLQVNAKLKYETTSVYLSAVKRYIIEEVGSNIFQNDSWYKTLRNKTRKVFQNECLESGEPLENRAEPMSVEELAGICLGLFNMKDYKDRALLCIQYHCFGRISEVIVLNLSSLKWNSSLLCPL